MKSKLVIGLMAGSLAGTALAATDGTAIKDCNRRLQPDNRLLDQLGVNYRHETGAKPEPLPAR